MYDMIESILVPSARWKSLVDYVGKQRRRPSMIFASERQAPLTGFSCLQGWLGSR